MNSKPVDTLDSGESLNLPEPDPDNITVLTRNLPNTPILPWNHYDSPWALGEESEQEADNSDQNTENLNQNAENQEELEPAAGTTEVADELDGELEPAVATTEVAAELDGELHTIATTIEATDEINGELDTAAATTEMADELDGNQRDGFKPLPIEEILTDELTS